MDFKKIGFKSGLEIHQQLDSSKLFCSCPSLLRDDKPDFVIKRNLRAVAGENGEIDIAAFYEQLKGKHFLYEGYDDTTCLVELDEEPPHKINEDALKIAFLVSKMMHCNIPEQVQVMRKTVIDGSNTSAFQRTVLIGRNGWIKVGNNKVGIDYLILEEDAARRVAETKNSVTYRLDRLGIPLLEIVTAPDLKTPEEVKKAAETIGMILRSTGKVRRGIGTVRQDINISIKGHSRVEMKGVQDLKSMIKYVEEEVKRQIKTKGKEKPHVRNVKPDFTSKFLRPLPGAARMYPETDIPLVNPQLKKVKLPELISDRKIRFEKLGLSSQLAEQLSKSERISLFEKLVKFAPARFVADFLINSLKDMKKRLNADTSKLSDSDFVKVFEEFSKNRILKDAIYEILSKKALGKKLVIKSFKTDSSKVEKEIETIVKKFPDLSEKALMGEVMKKFRGKIDGRLAMELILKFKK
jgi:Glu-tRNA(Gln) amidotransferase subunit E-like FAD-binding protein